MLFSFLCHQKIDNWNECLSLLLPQNTKAAGTCSSAFLVSLKRYWTAFMFVSSPPPNGIYFIALQRLHFHPSPSVSHLTVCSKGILCGWCSSFFRLQNNAKRRNVCPFFCLNIRWLLVCVLLFFSGWSPKPKNLSTCLSCLRFLNEINIFASLAPSSLSSPALISQLHIPRYNYKPHMFVCSSASQNPQHLSHVLLFFPVAKKAFEGTYVCADFFWRKWGYTSSPRCAGAWPSSFSSPSSISQLHIPKLPD